MRYREKGNKKLQGIDAAIYTKTKSKTRVQAVSRPLHRQEEITALVQGQQWAVVQEDQGLVSSRPLLWVSCCSVPRVFLHRLS